MAYKQVALKHCMLELRIDHTYIVITTLVLRPSTLSFLGHNKKRQRRFRGFSAGLEGRAAWMMKDLRSLFKILILSKAQRGV